MNVIFVNLKLYEMFKGSLFYVDDFIYNGYICVIFGIIELIFFYLNEYGDDYLFLDCCLIN